MRFGVDLGTTRTVVAVWDDGNHPVLSFARGDDAWADWFPSAIAARGESERVFGWEALARVGDPEWSVVRSFKRVLAEPGVTPDTEVVLGAQRVGILALLTEFLTALRGAICAQGALPGPLNEGEPMEAVVATPAWASSAQRLITVEAFRRAGFEVVLMVHEPAAAGVEYARRWARTLSSKRAQILVYDLGGGTFDVALVDLASDVYRVVRHDGLNTLGGDDFDDVLMALALDQAGIARALLDAWSVSTLREHCRVQKESLHPNSRRVMIELGACLSSGARAALNLCEDDVVTVKVADYYAACLPLVEQTLAVLDRALDGELERVAGVYVVGGASALPVVARVLREPFGRRVHRAAYPAASTAIGLSMLGEALATGAFALEDQLARHVGVFREWDDGRDVSFDVLFDAATSLPSEQGTVELVRTYRAAHNIGHFRYVACTHLDSLGAPSGHVAPVADVVFPFDPALREGKGSLAGAQVQRLSEPGALIEERYRISPEGVVELLVRDLEDGYSQEYRLG